MNEIVKKDSVEQFNNWAPHYDRGVWSHYFKYSVKRVVNLYNLDYSKILDIGCATGELCFTVADSHSANEIIGIDISPEMISISITKLHLRNNNNNNISFTVGDAKKLPFHTNYFDYIFCLNSFHHYPNPKQVVEEIHRVLRRGGKLILLDASRDGFLRRFWINMLNRLFKERESKYYTLNELNTLFRSDMFDRLKIQTLLYFGMIVTFEKTND